MGSKSTASLTFLTTAALIFITALFSNSCNAIQCYDSEQLVLDANTTNLNMKNCASRFLFCSAFKGYSNGKLYYLMRCDNYETTSTDIILNRCFSNDSYATYTNAVACFCDTDYCNDPDSFTKFNLLSEPTSSTTTTITTTTTTFTTTFITPKANSGANDVKLNVAMHILVTGLGFFLLF